MYLILNDSALRNFFTKKLKFILAAIYSNLFLCTKEMRILFKPISLFLCKTNDAVTTKGILT